MKLIKTQAIAAPGDFAKYIHNCNRSVCELPFSAPLPSIPMLQIYIDFGQHKPYLIELYAVNTCQPDHIQQLFTSNFIVGEKPGGGWYGVFKHFHDTVDPLGCFVVWASAMVLGPLGFTEVTFFSEEICINDCDNLVKVKACMPEGNTDLGFDINDVYYGLPVNNNTWSGMKGVRYFHIAYVRQAKVRELTNKLTLKSSLYRNFRTTIEKLWQLELEIVPRWYKDVLLAIYSRGVIEINKRRYLVEGLNFEALNDDDLMWKAYPQLKETHKLYFGCDESLCVECCSPKVISVTHQIIAPCCSPEVLSVSHEILYDEDAQAYFNALANNGYLATQSEKTAYNNFVLEMKNHGLYNGFKAIYPFLGAAAGPCAINAKTPGTFNISFNGCVFNSTGVDANGTTDFGNTGFNPLNHLTGLPVAIGFYSRENVISGVNSIEMGVTISTNHLYIGIRYPTLSNNQIGRAYNTTVQSSSPTSNTKGLFVTTLVGTNCRLYKNSIQTGSGYGGGTRPNGNIFLFARNQDHVATYHSSKECGFAFIYDGDLSGDMINVYNTIQALMIALGRDV